MIHALLGFMRLEFNTARRYWLNSIAALMFAYVLFVLLFLGITSYAGPAQNLGEAIESLIVGYWVVLLTNLTFQSFESFVTMESVTGTLEQLYLSPFHFSWLAFSKMLAALIYSLGINIPFLFLMMLTTGKWLHIDVISITPLVLLIVAQAFGLSTIMGGLAMVFKRVGALSQAVAMLLVLFIVAPPSLSPLVSLLPFNLAWRLLRDVMSQGIPIWMLPAGDLTFVVLQTIIIFAVGYMLFMQCERIAKRQGLIGQH